MSRQLIKKRDSDYIESAIDKKTPGVPPLQYQHDLLIPWLFDRPVDACTALQIGVGYGALLYALLDLGVQTTGVDIDLTLYKESYPVIHKPIANPTMLECNFLDLSFDKTYDLIIADICGAFKSNPEVLSLKAFDTLRRLLTPSGIMSFNIGIWPEHTVTILKNALIMFNTVAIVPNTQVMLCTDMNQLPPMSRLEPSWLCSSRNYNGC